MYNGVIETSSFNPAPPPPGTPPTVTTGFPTSITTSSMYCNGLITSTGGYPITDAGFYFGTDPVYTNNTKYNGATVIGNNIELDFTGLNSGTLYYFTVWALNAAGFEGIGSTSSELFLRTLI